MDRFLPSQLPEAGPFDTVVLATPHKEFFDLDLPKWLDGARPVILDTANMVSKDQRQRCRAAGIRIESVGRGDGL
jgi:UDP-N-acetyl-D-mannosaminuronate dehydrogenase